MTPRLALAALLTSFAFQTSNAQSPDARSTIEAAATALGMVRGVTRRMDSINTVQFSGRGTLNVPEADGNWTRVDVTDATVGISYSLPAMRWDMTCRDAGGEQRTIQVVRSDRAWDERLPGIDPTPAADQTASRRLQIWLTPHGVIRAAADDPDAASIETRGGLTTLSVDIDGTPVTATLDENFRPANVATIVDHPALGETRLEAVYSDYVDWPKLDVYFPSRIVHRLGGETTLDLTVTEFFQNPYVVFPTPEQLSRSSQ